MRGLSPDDKIIRRQNFFKLVSAYENQNDDFSLQDFQSQSWRNTMDTMIGQFHLQNDPTVQFGMAKRLYDSGRSVEGWPYLKQAIRYAFHDKKPEILINNIITLMLDNNMEQFAVRLGEKAIKRFPNDEIMHNTLAIAAVNAKMGKIFDWLKPRLKMPVEQLDYLSAKLAFLGGKLQKTKDILFPYIAGANNCKNSMIGLYLACVTDDDGIHALIPLMKTPVTYAFLLERKKEWEENPLRDFAQERTDTYSSSWRIHVEGVNASANRQAGV